MPTYAYLKIKGQKQGEIKGSVIQKGREGLIQVMAAIHDVISPRDAQSGLPTGQRQHKPLTITKEIDRSTPLLRQALITNETLTEWELQFFKPTSSGVETRYFVIKLTNAAVASARLVMPDAVDVATKYLPTYEELAFTYQKIEWTWIDGGITAQDEWQAPVT